MKNKILDSFLTTLKREFIDFGEISVGIIIKGELDSKEGYAFSSIVSMVTLEYSEESIFFSDETKKFYYEGETSLGSFSEIKRFSLTEENLVRLPKGLTDGLIRVANTRISETFNLEKDIRMLDF